MSAPVIPVYSIVIPLEQGLRHVKCPPHIVVLNSIVIPLEQGLRRELRTITLAQSMILLSFH